MIPHDHHVKRVLILGLGGGTIAWLLTHRFGPIAITGVERDAAVVAVSREMFGLRELSNVRVVVADAFAFVREDPGSYDLVCVDVYRGGRMPRWVLGQTFLRHVRRLLSPGGIAAFDLWRSRRTAAAIRRIHRVLPVRRTIQVEENVVVYCTERVQRDSNG